MTKTKSNQNTDWILWQHACDDMQAEMLKELRALFRKKPVCTHKEIDALLCEVHNPAMPNY